MPNTQGSLLPGVQGRDYHFVKVGGQIYVVYGLPIAGTGAMRISFKIDAKDYDAYGIKPADIGPLSPKAFQNVQHLGNASDIVINGTDHPFTQYLRHLQDINGHVSWLHNREFMGVMLQGFADGWSQTEVQQKLTTTKWYQSRTQTQRNWDLNMSKGDQKAATSGVISQMREQLRALYGPNYNLADAGVTQKQLQKMADNIASGQWGTVDEGFQLWTQKARNKAEKVEGTPAWIAQEQQLEDQKNFLNRPEDMLQKLKDQSYQALGPQGQPDVGTLKNWAKRLVTGDSSEADWTQYVQKQAKALYPWLDPGQTWQDSATSYKNILEQQLGVEAKWEDPLLAKLGATDANGVPTGAAMSFGDFTKAVRGDSRFWQSPTAANDTYSLFNRINQTFNGAGA